LRSSSQQYPHPDTGEKHITRNDLFAATTAAAGPYLAVAKRLASFCPEILSVSLVCKQ
jgi:hypothetical protein